MAISMLEATLVVPKLSACVNKQRLSSMAPCSGPCTSLSLTPASKKSRRTTSRLNVRAQSVETDDSSAPAASAAPVAAPSACDEMEGPKQGLGLRREPGMEEVFAKLDTGKWECKSCGYTYDATKGDASYPVSPGVLFTQLPEDWRCPTCGAPQSGFSSMQREVAGFAQNQKYGLGANSLTAGQKSLLIYGALASFFLLFLSGYLFQ